MNIKRLVLGSLAGVVTLFVLGYVMFEQVFADFYAANAGSATGVARENPVVWAVVLGTLAYAILMTRAIESRGGSASMVDGAKIGATVGFLIWLTADMTLFGYQNVSNLTLAITDPLLELVRGGISGGVIALVLSKAGT